ncbi:MAG TPA: hypothetical protein VMA34_13945 [Terracidiphilus sp.]|nr:hypothetical protein [Terracidiphilus sp.]
MFAATFESAAPVFAAPTSADMRSISLNVAEEELARLRFAVLLTARWEATGGESPEQRKELLQELRDLRHIYGDKIDEIAMTYGVAEAMRAKEEVERTVTLPSETFPSEPARVDDGLCF